MKRAGVLVKALMLVVVVAFVGWTAWDLAGRWRASPSVDLHWGWAAAAVLPIAGVSLAQGLGWVSLMQRMVGRRLPWAASLELFLASMLGRYLPAKVGMPTILMVRARQLSLAPALMGSSMLLIVLVYTILGAGLGVAALTVGGGPMPEQLAGLRGGVGALALAGMAVAVLLLLTVDRRRYPQALLRRLEIGGEGPLVGPGMVAWYGVVWLAWWAHGALLIVAVGGGWDTAAQGAGLFVLAPVAGFLALVAPGGLGVREAVIAVGVGASVGPGGGVAAALLSRMISLGVDVGMWLGFRAWLRQHPPAAPDPDA